MAFCSIQTQMVSLTTLALLVTTALLLGLATFAWLNSERPGAAVFATLQATAIVWVLLTAVGLSLSPGWLRRRVWGVTTALSLLTVVLWLAFILSYTGRDRWLTLQRFGPIAAPLVVGAGLYAVAPAWVPLAGPLTQEVIGAGTVVISSVGPVGGLLGVYLYLVFLSGFGLVLRTALAGPRLFTSQCTTFVLGTLVPVVGSLLVVAEIPTSGYPLTQLLFSVQALLWGYAAFGQEFLRIVPAVAEIGERAIFDEIDDAVLVVDTDGTVIRANSEASTRFETDPTGEDIEQLLAPADVSIPEDTPVRFRHNGRSYQITTSDVGNWRNKRVGHAVLIRDITPLVQRQQRLEVLNRILRHNVRNDMNVVMMIGEKLQSREATTLSESGETLYRKADKLTTISEKALEIDQAFDSQPVSRRIDVESLVRDVVSSLSDDHPDATVLMTATAETVRSNPRVLSLVLEEAVENALEHAGDSPEVQVTASGTDSGVEISVTDDGPGIPRMEYDPLFNGGETALEHASGLGLWVVYWGVQSLGGEVDIETNDDGSTVILSVPDTAQSDDATREFQIESPPQPRSVAPGVPGESPNSTT
jgi:signal transduction histidine kinase